MTRDNRPQSQVHSTHPARRNALFALAIAVAAALNGCAQPAANGLSAVGDLGDAGYKAQLDQSLRGAGWRPLGLVRQTTNGEPDAVYVSSVQRTGSTVRMQALTVFAAGNAAKSGVGSLVTTREFNCEMRNARIVDARQYADRALAVPASRQPTVSTVAVSVAPGSGTFVQNTFNALCDGKGSATGVIVADQRVLTNAHVVDGCRELMVADGQRGYPAKVTVQDRQTDLALLAVDDLPAIAAGNLPSLRRSPMTGESLIVAGYPLSTVLASDLNVQTGIVNALAGAANDTTRFQMSASVQPGNSGGPVLDRSGSLLGIVSSKLTSTASAALNATNVNFAIKPEIVRLFLTSNNVRVVDTDLGARDETERVTERARRFTLRVDCSHRMIGP